MCRIHAPCHCPTLDWRLESHGWQKARGSCACLHFQHSGLGTEQCLYVQGPVIPSSEQRERGGLTTKGLRARVVDEIVCCVAQCERFVVGAL